MAPCASETSGMPAVSSSIFVTFLTDFTGFFAVLLITFLAPLVAKFALKFGAPEFFAVYLLTFCAFVGMGREPAAKVIAAMMLGGDRVIAAVLVLGEDDALTLVDVLPRAAEADIARAADLLLAAKRPGLFVGWGAVDALPQLVELAAKGPLDERHQFF